MDSGRYYCKLWHLQVCPTGALKIIASPAATLETRIIAFTCNSQNLTKVVKLGQFLNLAGF